MSDIRRYANAESRSRRSKSWENGWFQSLPHLPVCM